MAADRACRLAVGDPTIQALIGTDIPTPLRQAGAAAGRRAADVPRDRCAAQAYRRLRQFHRPAPRRVGRAMTRR
jgi:hypothetical protein